MTGAAVTLAATALTTTTHSAATSARKPIAGTNVSVSGSASTTLVFDTSTETSIESATSSTASALLWRLNGCTVLVTGRT